LGGRLHRRPYRLGTDTVLLRLPSGRSPDLGLRRLWPPDLRLGDHYRPCSRGRWGKRLRLGFRLIYRLRFRLVGRLMRICGRRCCMTLPPNHLHPRIDLLRPIHPLLDKDNLHRLDLIVFLPEGEDEDRVLCRGDLHDAAGDGIERDILGSRFHLLFDHIDEKDPLVGQVCVELELLYRNVESFEIDLFLRPEKKARAWIGLKGEVFLFLLSRVLSCVHCSLSPLPYDTADPIVQSPAHLPGAFSCRRGSDPKYFCVT
jgi:hypothetical protein